MPRVRVHVATTVYQRPASHLHEPHHDAEGGGGAKGRGEEEQAHLGEAAAAPRPPRRRARQLHAHVRNDYARRRKSAQFSIVLVPFAINKITV